VIKRLATPITVVNLDPEAQAVIDLAHLAKMSSVPSTWRSLWRVQIHCADCGCFVDRGVVIRPCESDECCCTDLPGRES
jgi:hypothetical protein